jgi:hypothetical protein
MFFNLTLKIFFPPGNVFLNLTLKIFFPPRNVYYFYPDTLINLFLPQPLL